MSENNRFDNEKCNVCSSKDNLKRCSRCKCVAYCCIDHQKQDWRSHKKDCSRESNQEKDHKNGSKKDTGFQSNSHVQERHVSISNTEVSNSVFITENQQSEVESILDFSSISLPKSKRKDSNSANTTKDIFSDLINSEVETYSGPESDAYYTEEIDPQENPDQLHEVSYIDDGSENPEADTTETDLTPFDPRPYCKLEFPKPKSYEHKDLAEFISQKLIKSGYCIVDGVFPKDVIEGVTSEVKNLKTEDILKTGKLAGGRTSGNDTEKVTETSIRSDLIKWIEGREEESLPFARQVLFTMDAVVNFINNKNMRSHGFIEGRTKAMLACYPGNGTYYRRHVDNPTKDGRRITCILYLNKDWNIEKDGGLLRIFPSGHDQPVDVPPLANRLLFFWSDSRNPHEVQPAYKDRYAMTVWYFDTEEREAAKVEELHEETQRITAQIADLERKRIQLETLNAAQEVENRAMQAVRDLSPAELEAISVMLRSEPNARQILTAMGISHAIQEALVIYVAQNP